MITGKTGTDFINLGEAKNFLKVSNSVDDALITQLISASIEKVEMYLGIDFVEKSFSEIYYSYKFTLTHQPVTNIDSVDRDYTVTGIGEKEVTVQDVTDGVSIQYTCSSSYIPEIVKSSVLQQIAIWYEDRGVGSLDSNIKKDLSGYRKIVI